MDKSTSKDIELQLREEILTTCQLKRFGMKWNDVIARLEKRFGPRQYGSYRYDWSSRFGFEAPDHIAPYCPQFDEDGAKLLHMLNAGQFEFLIKRRLVSYVDVRD